ncbi:hypothetical protein [Collinsella sp. AF38-3AC]|uniref:hypothetical protein n=1 Tax=Collinsella sp. AF38-3AC TaxID=2292015 RepID=UPI000FF2B2AF|nr:hypothetical protein [Collinsella sp. AF38-3AC]RHL25388.1 hypothetical protein DW029_02845 [Collinsella sp. AF38-3AC]
MALVINLHGPNTNTLGKLTAGALAEMGYRAAAVPSVRREMELKALRGDERAIRLTDGSLDSCVELASLQADRNQRSIDPELDAVIVCGPVVDSFWGYKGNREDSFYRTSVETALELDACQYELVPSGSLTECTLSKFRSFLRDCGVRPRISRELDYGYHDIIDIVRGEVALDRKKHPVKGAEKVDAAPDCERAIAGFKNAAISVQEAIKSLPEGSEMRLKLEGMVNQALEDGYGGIHIETVRRPEGKTMSLGDLVQSEVDAASKRKDEVRDQVDETAAPVLKTIEQDEAGKEGKDKKEKEKKNNKEKEKDMENGDTQKKPEYINIRFENKDVRVKPYTDRNGNERLRINMTMPKGTVVGGKDLSGMKVSMPAREFMKQDKDAGEPVRYGFRSDRGVHFFRYDENNQRIDYPAEGDPAIMPRNLAAAVAAAYEGKEAAKAEPQRNPTHEYTGLTFAPCDMKVKTVPTEDGPDKNFLLCKLPPHTKVGQQDLGGMIVSKFLSARQLPYAQSGRPFTASFRSAMPVRVYPVNGEDSRDNFDYDFRSPQEFSAGALVAGIEDAYDARLLNARNYEEKLEATGAEMSPAAASAKQMLEDRDGAATRQGSKAAALEYHRTGSAEDMPLNDLCDAKSDEAVACQDGQPYVIAGSEPDLYDEDVEF